MADHSTQPTEKLALKHLTIHVDIQVSPSDVPAFLTALRPVWVAVTNEPKCLFFDIWHSEAEPGKFRFVEVWDADRKWMEEVQLQKTYYEPYVKVTQPMWIKDRVIDIYERAAGWSYVSDTYLEGSAKA